jgi:hypothetical protein
LLGLKGPFARAPFLVGLAWFVLALGLIFWGGAARTLQFLTPDEALNRFAAVTVSTTGRPYLELPFPDPEDLVHPRGWLTLGDRAVPTYAPVSIYFYSFFAWLGDVGTVLLAVLPASGAAAFAAGVARLLPERRRALALTAPALGLPALYWLLRPWMNLSLVLVSVCFAFYAWCRYREDRTRAWLFASFAAVGAGAAVRPDYAAYLLAGGVLFVLAADPTAWKAAVIGVLAAGISAVALNLVLNHVVTGHAFKAAYQMAVDREYGTDDLPAWLRLPRALVFPMGLPALTTIATVFSRYWVLLLPLPLLLACQFLLAPLLAGSPRSTRFFLLGALLVLFVFMVSRSDLDLFGSKRTIPEVQDSVPRYWSPIYLLAGLPPLFYFGKSERRRTFVAGSVLLGLLALFSLYVVTVGSSQSVARGRADALESTERVKRIVSLVPPGALVYSPTCDKFLWAHLRVATFGKPDDTASSMKRALSHGVPTFLWICTKRQGPFRALEKSLAQVQLAPVALDEPNRLYRIEPRQ